MGLARSALDCLPSLLACASLAFFSVSFVFFSFSASSASVISFLVRFLFRSLGLTHSAFAFKQGPQTGILSSHLPFLFLHLKQANGFGFGTFGSGP